MGHDLMLWQVETELQGHQDGELEGDQFPPIQPELLFQFLKNTGRRFIDQRENGRETEECHTEWQEKC